MEESGQMDEQVCLLRDDTTLTTERVHRLRERLSGTLIYISIFMVLDM